jgi:hypothetical protein
MTSYFSRFLHCQRVYRMYCTIELQSACSCTWVKETHDNKMYVLGITAFEYLLMPMYLSGTLAGQPTVFKLNGLWYRGGQTTYILLPFHHHALQCMMNLGLFYVCHWSRSCDFRLQFLTPIVFKSSSTVAVCLLVEYPLV